MDMNKLEPPRKDQKTPKKEPIKLGSGTGSRPSSPEREIILVVCSNILNCLQNIRYKSLCCFTESYGFFSLKIQIKKKSNETPFFFEFRLTLP